MLNLTKKVDYALVALASLARDESGEPVSARQIAEQFRLPSSMLGNLLKDLAAADIVTSVRGAQGGYRLERDPARVPLLEVVAAIEGTPRLTDCCDGLPIVGQGCELADRCPICDAVQRLHERLGRFFESVTLAELLGDESPTDPTMKPMEPVEAGAA